MKIYLVTPAPPGALNGNRVTALRWRGILRRLGHRVIVEQQYRGGAGDLLIALHARRSFDSIDLWRREHPEAPLVVVLTGTDLYQDLETSAEARRALDWATQIVALQPLAADKLPFHLRSRLRVIYQSARAPSGVVPRSSRHFKVIVLGHLRPVKDPFRTAEAARLLPPSSRVRVAQLGDALSPEMEKQAREEMAVNPRYRWIGPLPRWQALRELRRSHIMVLSSVMEGGANVISEAIAASVPVLSSRIAGSIGLLGEDYSGYFPVGDTRALADLLNRAETDAALYADLKGQCERLAPLVDPAREEHSWRELMDEL